MFFGAPALAAGALLAEWKPVSAWRVALEPYRLQPPLDVSQTLG